MFSRSVTIHDEEFELRFIDLFRELVAHARAWGHRDPADFAHDVLFEYLRWARRKHYDSVHEGIIRILKRHRIIDIHRGMQRRPEPLGLDRALSLESPVPGEETENGGTPSAGRILSLISPKARKILEMKLLRDLSDVEIAEEMSMTINGVRTCIKRSKKKLRTMYERPVRFLRSPPAE